MSRYLLLALCVLTIAPDAGAQPRSPEQQAAFLLKANVIASRQTTKGVTASVRLTLTDGTITHDAHFQSIDESRALSNTGRGRKLEINFMDSWRFNVAAYRVATLLGLDAMVPVSVERSWNGKIGAMTWWVDDVLMDEETRQKTGVEPPEREEHNKQTLRMRVFTQLVYDTDRNKGNVLFTTDWRLVMIDFTRAFRPWRRLPDPITILRRCDRALLERMRGLRKEEVQKTVGRYLSSSEVDGLLARRDLIVQHFDDLVAKLGEENVLY